MDSETVKSFTKVARRPIEVFSYMLDRARQDDALVEHPGAHGGPGTRLTRHISGRGEAERQARRLTGHFAPPPGRLAEWKGGEAGLLLSDLRNAKDLAAGKVRVQGGAGRAGAVSGLKSIPATSSGGVSEEDGNVCGEKILKLLLFCKIIGENQETSQSTPHFRDSPGVPACSRVPLDGQIQIPLDLKCGVD